MKVIPPSDVGQTDKNDKKRLYLDDDAICMKCGTIFNIHQVSECITCDHSKYIAGKLSRDIRLILDFNILDLMSLCDIHNCSTGSRPRMVINIIKSIHNKLNKNINELLIRKIILRNKKKFYYLRDIDTVMESIKSRRKPRVIKIRKKLKFINDKYVLSYDTSKELSKE